MDGDPHVDQLTRPRRKPIGFAPGRIALAGIAGVGAVLLCGVSLASAASVTVTTDSVTGGNVGVPRCSTAGVQVLETVAGLGNGTVSSVVINNIDAACAGGTLSLTLNSGGGSTVSASGTVPAGGGTMTLSLAPAPASVVGNEVDLVVVGP